MPKNNQNFNQELEGFLRASGFDNLSTKDVDGDDVPSAKEADQFIFQYSKNGKDYGNVVITTHGGKVSVYYNQNLNRGPDGSDTGWTKFLMKLKDWALRNGQMEFKAGNIDNIGYEMKKRKQQKREENLSEGYYGTRHTSYSDNTPKIKMIIKHSKSIDEGDQRYRYIDKIFLENELGERVLIPTKKPSVGHAFARHLAEGGQYNDERWKHIREIAEDINSLSGFVRATKTKQFNEGVMQVVNEAANHYQQLRETIKKLQNSRGYNMYFENWQPQLMEQDSDQDFSSMFVSNRLDPRIEQALPVLNKLNIKVNEIQEATEFEQWANSIVEGQSPAMDHKVKEFAKLLSEPDSLPVGADAMNVKGQLEDLIDDQDHRNALFDELDDLAYSDPDNDSIPTIISFLQKHKDEKFYGEVLDHVGEKTDIPSDQEIATEPETATQASAPATPPVPQTPAAPSSGAAGAAAPFMPQPLAEKAKKPVQRNFVAKHAQRSGAGSHGKKGFQRHDKHKKKLGEEVVTEGYSELDNLQKKFEGTIERILQRAKEEGRGPDQLTDREKKAIAILKGEQQGVAEGSTGVSVRKWANQVRKDNGTDVKFWNRKEGGGAVDSVVAKNSNGEIVGVYNRKTGYPTVFEPKQDAAKGSLNEFAPISGGGDDILKTLAAQWLHGDIASGDLSSDIQSQEQIERRLENGINCPDGVKRKLYIDYNGDYDGVVIYGDDDWSIDYNQNDLNESKIEESLNGIKRLSGLK